MRIGHASISENNNNGRDGKAKAGDQTGKEVCIRTFYKKPWKYLLRCKDANKAEKMARACEAACANDHIGYDQSRRNTLNDQAKLVGYDLEKIKVDCSCDCSSLMAVCAIAANIAIPFSGGNAPVTANMVKIFEQTGCFDVLTEGINEEHNLRRGDILVGPPNTHTVMVLDNGQDVPLHIKERRTLKKGMSGSDVVYMQRTLQKLGYDLGKWGADAQFGDSTEKAVRQFQIDRCLTADGICGPKTWMMLEKYN